MNWLESILYGIISGITDFLPLSSFAHQQLILQIFGAPAVDPGRDLFVHIGLLSAIWISTRSIFDNARRDRHLRNRSSSRALRDYQLTKSATLPMLLMLFILSYIFRELTTLPMIALGLLINGVVLYLPDRLLGSNKDASAMSPLDGTLIGVAGALTAVPGFSRIGCTVAVASVRGADRRASLNWALMLSIPALGGLIFVDLISLIAGIGSSAWSCVFDYILSGIAAFGAACIGIRLIRFWLVKNSDAVFAYYSWGAALFTFFLYLTVV